VRRIVKKLKMLKLQKANNKRKSLKKNRRNKVLLKMILSKEGTQEIRKEDKMSLKEPQRRRIKK